MDQQHDQDSSNQSQDLSGATSRSPHPALASIRHPVADDDEIESYARGVISGTMKTASPNVVGSLLARIRQLLKVEEDRERLRRQVQDLNRGTNRLANANADISSECHDLTAKNNCLNAVLARIVADLPTKRDWLDPAMEQKARLLLSKGDASASSGDRDVTT